MKIKKEYIILIIVIAGLLFYLMQDRSDRTHYELPVISEVPQATVTKIVLSESTYKIELIRKDNSWLIQPQNFIADTSKVTPMLAAIEKMTLTALVSESGPYERYLLSDDKKIHLAAWAGDKIAREFDIGKPASSNQHTFIRLDKETRVFHARGNLRQAFDYTIDQLRDKSVLTFEEKTISGFTVKEGETPVFSVSKESLEAEKPADPEKEKETAKPAASEKKPAVRWVGADGKGHDDQTISGWLSLFSGLKCERYIDTKKKAEYGDMKPLYTIELKGVKPCSLSVFNKTGPDDKTYPAISSENDYPFLLPDWKVDSIKNKIEDLKKTATDKKN